MARRLKILVRPFEGHRVQADEWEKARPVPLEGHRAKVEGPLVLSVKGLGRVEVRADDEGNLFLEVED